MTMIIDGSTGLEFPDGSDQTSAFTGNASSITSGTLAVARGGTGLSSVGTAGNFLQSNGTSWVSAANPPPFVSGTLMLFQQTSAPTGWTKQTTHDNKALRVVSGSASSGGSVGFTTAFASQTPAGSVAISGGSVGSTTLSTTQIPSHTHPLGDGINSGALPDGRFTSAPGGTPTGSTGGGGSHTHSFTAPTASFTGTAINLAVSYVDLIIASKD